MSWRGSHAGGGGRWIHEKPGLTTDPERARDLALAQDAYHHMLRRLRGCRVNGAAPAQRDSQVFYWCRDIMRDLARSPFSRLSQNKREKLLAILGRTGISPLPDAAVPEGLRCLPKKPPGRAA